MFIEDEEESERRKPERLITKPTVDGPGLRRAGGRKMGTKKNADGPKMPPNPTGKGGFQKGKSGNPAGKPKGATNYYNRLTNEERQEIAAAANGLTPLELFISVARSEDAPMDVRVEAAKAAAPYMHRKMPIAIEGGDPNKPINFLEIAQMKNLKSDELKALLVLLRKAGGNVLE